MYKMYYSKHIYNRQNDLHFTDINVILFLYYLNK